MIETDEELIVRARAAATIEERNAVLELLFERHYRRVALWCIRWTNERQQAEDLAQEIFLKVHRSLHLFEGQAKFSTWLFTVCRNHCINAGMAAKSREHVELDDLLSSTLSSSDPDPEAQLAERNKWSTAKEMLEKHLDETERQVFLLHHVEGWSVPMVSKVLNLTNPSGAKAYLVSGSRKLKAAVARWKAKQGREE